jgi:ABC-type polysaccharide/polyol phosphate transport system ATPase subunit
LHSGKITPLTQQSDPPPHLIAKEVGVTFPVNKLALTGDPKKSDPRLIRGRDGRIVGFRALDGISFSLEKGDRLAIVGRNGSGKTTLLQVMAGILSPNVGSLSIAGRVTSLININLGIQPEATGHRNITLKGLAAGYSRKEIAERREQIAEFSGIGAFLDMPMSKYSSGMKMRLIFSIATAFDPEILILDEWLSAGDAAFRAKATQKMREFVERANILVLASHSKDLILDNCNKGLWLDGGQIRAFGEIDDIMDKYLNFQDSLPKSPPPVQLASSN